MDNENEDKIKIRRMNSEYQLRLETRNMFWGRGTKTEKKDYDNKPNILSLLFLLYCKKGMCAGEALAVSGTLFVFPDNLGLLDPTRLS